MISTVFFDIGNVLVGFDHNLIWQRLTDFSPYSLQEIRQRIQAADLMVLHETGKLPPQEFFQALQHHLKLNSTLSFQMFWQIWADIFWENPPLITLTETLHAHYTIGVLSNTGEIHWKWLLSQFPIFRQFDLRILSYQVGCMKPAPEIYREAIRHAHTQPHACVYLDDIPAYVEASRQLGIHGIHYQSPEQVQFALEKLRMKI